KNLIYLCTPFSRAAAKRLEEMSVSAFKIGSGECNNLPLIDYICGFNKPIVLSTGMNDLSSIKRSASKIRDSGNPLALLHCTSMYPTPYSEVRLPAITTLKREVPYAVVGISDHSLDIYTSLGAVALGASIVEKHFTSDKSWEGPDIPISIDKNELRSLIDGSRAIHEASCGNVGKLSGEAATIRFAYASVVSTRKIEKGEELTRENVWVKRPGTGAFRAEDYEQVLGRKAMRMILPDSQIEEGMLAEDDI
ncbi:MAG: polyhydroxyalkanoate biosynthesis repressor PhaR, partial [Verrucomicrobia bacterium TMED56]